MSIAPTPAGVTGAAASGLLARVPASFFSMALGVGALAAAWRAAARAYGTSPWLGDGLLIVAAALWVLVLAAQAVKAVSGRARLSAELADPVEGSLVALAPGSLLIIAAGVAGPYPQLARVLFWIGAAA